MLTRLLLASEEEAWLDRACCLYLPLLPTIWSGPGSNRPLCRSETISLPMHISFLSGKQGFVYGKAVTALTTGHADDAATHTDSSNGCLATIVRQGDVLLTKFSCSRYGLKVHLCKSSRPCVHNGKWFAEAACPEMICCAFLALMFVGVLSFAVRTRLVYAATRQQTSKTLQKGSCCSRTAPSRLHVVQTNILQTGCISRGGLHCS